MLKYSVKEVDAPFTLSVNPKVFLRYTFKPAFLMLNVQFISEERHTKFTMKTMTKIERDPGVGGINVPAACPGRKDVSTVIGLF